MERSGFGRSFLFPRRWVPIEIKRAQGARQGARLGPDLTHRKRQGARLFNPWSLVHKKL